MTPPTLKFIFYLCLPHVLLVQCRETILELYQRQKFLKKKQLLDELEAREIAISEKLVVKALKV